MSRSSSRYRPLSAGAQDPGRRNFALSIVDELSDVTALRGYHLLPAVRGDLLLKLERRDEARSEFELAAAMTANEAERTLLLDRAASC
ncbi:hypothetical protein ACWEO2_43530 [Nocardia sp. NPDC004278]